MIRMRQLCFVFLGIFFCWCCIVFLRQHIYSLASMSARTSQGLSRLTGDTLHYTIEQEHLAVSEWRHRKALMSFKHCSNHSLHSNVAWVFALGNEAYLKPLLVMVTTLELFSCVYQRIILVPPTISINVIAKLKKMKLTVVAVRDDFKCKGLDIKRWQGTFLRYHAFSMTEYTKLVYIDVDFMLLSNIDHLFQYAQNAMEIAAAQFERPMTVNQLGTLWGDNGFNAGLMVFRPQLGMTQKIVDEWKYVGCKGGVTDQPFLYHYFHVNNYNVILLPFSINVRKVAYHPMQAFHFAGGPHLKMWTKLKLPEEVKEDIPVHSLADVAHVFWHYLYLGEIMFNVSVVY